jgi:hypothetical protein
LAGITLEGGVFDATNWTKHRAVMVSEPGVQALELDTEVMAGARDDFGDLRLVRGGRQVPYLIERTKLSRTVELKFLEERVEKQPTLSGWKVMLPQEQLPLVQLRLEASSGLFARSLAVFEERVGRDGGVSRFLRGEGQWRRDLASVDNAGRVMVSERPKTGVLWLETENGDNPPIGLTRVQAVYPVTRLLFQATSASVEGGERIELWYGNVRASAPRYDVGLVAGRLLAAERRVATLSAGAAATAVSEKRAEWFRAGWVFWVGLSVVVISLLFIVAKLLPQEPKR